MDEHSLFERIYQYIMILVGGLISFFFYRQRKINDQIDKTDERVDHLEVNQAKYNKSVDYLLQRFHRIENSHDKLSDKIDKLIQK